MASSMYPCGTPSIDSWFLHKDEPVKSWVQFLRTHILQHDSRFTEAWKYGMPF